MATATITVTATSVPTAPVAHARPTVSRTKWLRWVLNGAVTIAVLVALYALIGFLVLPTIAKPKIEVGLTDALGRTATIGRLEFNPFTLRGHIINFALADREPQRFLLRFAALDVGLSAASLRYRAPVLDAVRLSQPQIDFVRYADGANNVDDLIAKAASGREGPPLRFSLNNIEVEDGRVTLDDRLHHRMLVASTIGVGIPFLSSLPHDAQIRVTPRLDGAFDGARFALAANTTSPFVDTKETALEWNLDALPLARYAEYLTLPGGMKLTGGALTTRLRLAFITDRDTPKTIVVSGTTRVNGLAFARRDGTKLASARSIDIALSKLDLLGRSIAFDRVVVDGPEADLRREADGTLEFARLSSGEAARPPVAREAGKSQEAPARPWAYSVSDARVVDGTLRVSDQAVSPAFNVVLTKIGVEARQVASSGLAGNVDARFEVDDGARFDVRSQVDPSGPRASGRFALKTFHLAKLYPYYAAVLNLDVRRGTLDLGGEFRAAQEGSTTQFALAHGEGTISDLETGIRGEKDALWRVARGDLTGVAYDLSRQSVAIDQIALRQGLLHIVRERDGTANFRRLFRPSSAAHTRVGVATSPARARGSPASTPGFNVVIHRLELERIAADFEDRAAPTRVKLRIPDVRATVENYSNANGAKSTLDVEARIGQKGRLGLKGTVVADPFEADWRINANGLDVVPFRPYFEPQTNVVVTSGTVTARGRVTYATSRGGAPHLSYKGDATIGDFGSLDRPTSQELMRWKKLVLTGIDTSSQPLNLAIGNVAMNGFYARVILNADATLNLKELLKSSPETVDDQASRTVVGATTRELSPPAATSPAPRVSIGRIELDDGEVQYSDLFVQPNYNAHLTRVTGNVSALSASQAGVVEVSGRVEGTAPVELSGNLNPFVEQLQLDLIGKAVNVDLPPLTPYSVKYAGYGIRKGELSLEVHYKVENRKLVASNKLKLDQLTFGDRVESPTATKLPVLLVVSLLKDRNGVINLDLPIEGTLDDPKFSVWGVIVQIVVNLMTKAVTAPFALLASIAGGSSGEQLAYVEFVPGHADLTAESQTKLRTLAKALNDRPALKVDVVGRAIPDSDREGLKHATLDRAIRAQKQKVLAAEGESALNLDTLKIEAEEYPKLLENVYRDTKLPDKPRNVIGITKSVPPAEMEALLLGSYGVDDQALATLANRRAQTVKEWFAGQGGVDAERVFIVTPKLNADGISDKGAPTRVDFAIR